MSKAEGNQHEQAPAMVPLDSLASRYVEAHHKTYLDRLEQAVKDQRNRNIALTGRYGTGKSSILDEFERKHPGKTLRLAISTLRPDTTETSRTNRIQKELLKQLIYSASPTTLRRSRFSRRSSLSTTRAALEATSGVLVVGALLALLGWLPKLPWTDGQPRLLQLIIWLVFAGLVTLPVAVVRLLTHERFFVSDLSAAGAAVKLSARTPTYFDEYLDEIVNYFDEEAPTFIILEDLDRFDDPQIFEALRELNTVLNNTPKRVAKKAPLQFIYAVRDSLFEKLGSEVQDATIDAAAAETVRANRTKFFDLVIPVVPFISHRNARELLSRLLKQARITDIERPLVDLVARHSTDMRLLLNMRNEYLVFAERLLEAAKPAPGLTPSNLFALVAYKNFHLEDFEHISRRSSDLDRLYLDRRDLVRSCVAGLEKERRDLLANQSRVNSMQATAERLGQQLARFGELAWRSSAYASWPEYRCQIGAEEFTSEQLASYEFWAAATDAGSIDVVAINPPSAQRPNLLTLQRDDLNLFFSAAAEAGRWDRVDLDAGSARLEQIEDDLAFVKGADFDDLAKAGRFRLGVDGGERSFAQIVDATMKSDLARDLVKRGYIDRNFALYAAQFYGDFTGVDVATFIVQNVQTNTMEVDYQFTSPGAVENLLAETDDDFTHSVSAYNVDVLNHLLSGRDARADNIVDRIISNFDSQAEEFLSTYFSSGSQRTELAIALSSHPWQDVFTYLIKDENVPADIRAVLVDAALLAIDSGSTYKLDGTAEFVVKHYPEMPVFTTSQDEDAVEKVAVLLAQAGLRITDLAKVHEPLRAGLVHRNLYQITAPNLRTALDTNGEVSLDEVRKNSEVYSYCVDNPREYLAAVERDSRTPQTIASPETLIQVLDDISEAWSDAQIQALISGAAGSSCLLSVTDAPDSAWPALACAGLFEASLANLRAYLEHVGAIDENLAQLLVTAGAIDTDEDAAEDEPAKVEAAIAVLNSSDTISSAEQRVSLVDSLHLDGSLPVARLTPEPGDLLALLLEHGLVEDDAITFNHFRQAGWAALEPAILRSTNIADFLTPEILDGLVAELFSSRVARNKLGRQVLDALGQYIATDDAPALTAAASFAAAEGIPLPLDQIHRIAATATGRTAADPTLRLLQIASPAPTPAEIVATLAELGTPYSYLSTRAESEFEVPDDEAHRAVFSRLADANLCTTSKKRLKDILKVKVLSLLLEGEG